MTYVQREIQVQFQLGQGSFGNDGYSDVVIKSGLRAKINVTKTGSPSQFQMSGTLYGMSLSDMNQLSTLGQVYPRIRNNIVTVMAGDLGQPLSTVFSGSLQEAWIDFSNSPDGGFFFSGINGLVESLKPVAPTTYRGPIDAATVLQNLATVMSKEFEGNGVSVILQNPYYAGTAMRQAQLCADQAKLSLALDGNTLAVWPLGGMRTMQAQNTVTLTAGVDIVGYPVQTQNGLRLTVLFNPAIVFGGNVVVANSVITAANATWTVYRITHDLQARTPNGNWFTHLECTVNGQPAPTN